MMQLGAEGVFVGSGIFKSADPPARARAIVHATTHYEDPTRDRARPRSRWARRWPASTSRTWTRAACSSIVAGSVEATPPAGEPAAAGPRIGVLAVQGGFEAHCRCAAAPRRGRVEVRRPGHLDGLDGLVIPGGESTTIEMGIEAYGLEQPIRDFVAQRAAGARHLRRADHARSRAPGPDGHRGPPQRLRAPGPELRAGRARAGPRGRAAAGRLHPRAVDRGRRRRGRGAGGGGRPPGGGAGAQHARGRVPPRADRRPAPACAVPGHGRATARHARSSAA